MWHVFLNHGAGTPASLHRASQSLPLYVTCFLNQEPSGCSTSKCRWALPGSALASHLSATLLIGGLKASLSYFVSARIAESPMTGGWGLTLICLGGIFVLKFSAW